jgi:hypothetical protein
LRPGHGAFKFFQFLPIRSWNACFCPLLSLTLLFRNTANCLPRKAHLLLARFLLDTETGGHQVLSPCAENNAIQPQQEGEAKHDARNGRPIEDAA